MLDKWNVFDRRTYVGVLTYDEDTKQFSFELKSDHPRAIAAYKKINADKDPEWFKETLFDRIIPPNAVDIREVLNALGMIEYDAWELIKYVQLIHCNDLIWMTKGMDPNEFYKVHVVGEQCKEYDKKHPEFLD